MHEQVESMGPGNSLLKKNSVVFEGTAGVGAHMAPVAGEAAGGASLAVVYEDDSKQILEVTCRCGERLRILCQFGAVAQQAPQPS